MLRDISLYPCSIDLAHTLSISSIDLHHPSMLEWLPSFAHWPYEQSIQRVIYIYDTKCNKFACSLFSFSLFFNPLILWRANTLALRFNLRSNFLFIPSLQF